MGRLRSGTLIEFLVAILILTGCGMGPSVPSAVPQSASTPEPPPTAVPSSTPPLLPIAVPSSTPPLLPIAVPSSTPQPLPTATQSSAPEHVRLNLAYGIVVAFADDPSLGRVAYVTHVPSGAQAVLDRGGAIIDRDDSSGEDGEVLDVVLADGKSMVRIEKGLRYEGTLPSNPIADWIDLIRFDGVTYYRRAREGSGTSNEVERLNQSQLGPLLYRVAFSLDSNLLPSGYQIQDGDAAYLKPGTAIHSVNGYDSSLRLAAIVSGEALLYVRSP